MKIIFPNHGILRTRVCVCVAICLLSINCIGIVAIKPHQESGGLNSHLLLQILSAYAIHTVVGTTAAAAGMACGLFSDRTEGTRRKSNYNIILPISLTLSLSFRVERCPGKRTIGKFLSLALPFMPDHWFDVLDGI